MWIADYDLEALSDGYKRKVSRQKLLLRVRGMCVCNAEGKSTSCEVRRLRSVVRRHCK